MKKLIKDGLREEEKTLPTLLLYDNKGLKLFEDITYLDEYYLTGQEIAVLERHAERIAERIPPDAILLELGSGYVYFSRKNVVTDPLRLAIYER